MACWLCVALLLALFHLALLSIFFIFTTGRYKIRKNLRGKIFVVTGATAGIGKVTTTELAKNGAKVYMLCRNRQKAERVAKQIRKEAFNNDVHIIICNLSDFSTVREAAKQLLATGDKIDCLINNAGIMHLVGKQQQTMDGNEEMMQSNHFGHFLLTTLLLEHLKNSKSRIVNLSSIAGLSHWNRNTTSDFDVDDLAFGKAKYSGTKAYCWSKLANILFTKELSRKLEGSGATTNCCHPGAVATNLQTPNFGAIIDKGIQLLAKLGLMKSAQQGAMSSLYLATSDDVDNVSGEYFADCAAGAATVQALNRKLAEDLWEASEKVVAVKQ